jgi:hypothetical protein
MPREAVPRVEYPAHQMVRHWQAPRGQRPTSATAPSCTYSVPRPSPTARTEQDRMDGAEALKDARAQGRQFDDPWRCAGRVRVQ